MNEGIYSEETIWHRIFSHRVLVTAIVAILVAMGAYLWLLYWSVVPTADFRFQVHQTDDIHSVASRLMDEGVMKHRIFFYFSYYVFGRHAPIEPGGYKLSSSMRARDIVYALESRPESKYVELPANLSKDNIGKVLSSALGWGQLDQQFFSHTYAGMQWQHYQEMIEGYFEERYKWNEKKTHTFLTLSALFTENDYDFLKNMYVPGVYEIPIGSSRAQVAGILIDRFVSENPDDEAGLEKHIDPIASNNVAKLLEQQMVLMPDIVAIPPSDLAFKKIEDKTFLLFTTAYWNKGRGPLELLADPNTKAAVGDVERNVYQRIYRLDGEYIEKLSGKFLWHSPHLHYHFQDFAIYELVAADAPAGAESIIDKQKSTYCIRDMEPIDLTHPGANKSPSYKICGKERQGISAGWADAYYYSYVDQRFDVTNLPTGDYKLRITINPLDRFDEITKDNNVGEVLVHIDAANRKLKVLSEKTYGI